MMAALVGFVGDVRDATVYCKNDRDIWVAGGDVMGLVGFMLWPLPLKFDKATSAFHMRHGG